MVNIKVQYFSLSNASTVVYIITCRNYYKILQYTTIRYSLLWSIFKDTKIFTTVYQLTIVNINTIKRGRYYTPVQFTIVNIQAYYSIY